MRVVDLFSGAGGFSLGMIRAGHDVVAAYDWLPGAIATHKANIGPLQPRFPGQYFMPGRGVHRNGNLLDLLGHAAQIAELRPDVIVGGPPCQAFAKNGKRRGDLDPRAPLTEAYAVLVAVARPRYFCMENVPEVADFQVFQRATKILRRAGYGLSTEVVDMSYHGVAQTRVRLLLMGALGEADGWATAYVAASRQSRPTTVRDVLGDIGDPYFLYPAGASSHGTRRIDVPAPTLTKTCADSPGPSYRRKGDAANFRELPRLTIDQLAMLAGYPSGWIWTSQASKPLAKGKTALMIANSVPAPVSEMVGRVFCSHSEGHAAAHTLPVTLPPELGTWLAGRVPDNHLKQRLSEIRSALELLNGRMIVGPIEAERRLTEMPGFAALGRGRRSNLRAGIRAYYSYLDSISQMPDLAYRSVTMAQIEEEARAPATAAAFAKHLEEYHSIGRLSEASSTALD